jgi:hypothetical protein
MCGSDMIVWRRSEGQAGLASRLIQGAREEGLATRFLLSGEATGGLGERGEHFNVLTVCQEAELQFAIELAWTISEVEPMALHGLACSLDDACDFLRQREVSLVVVCPGLVDTESGTAVVQRMKGVAVASYILVVSGVLVSESLTPRYLCVGASSVVSAAWKAYFKWLLSFNAQIAFARSRVMRECLIA